MTRPDLFATPWEAQDNTVIAIHKGQAYRIASTKNKLFTIKAEETHARAIAAVPALLEALEHALPGLESDLLYCERHPQLDGLNQEACLAHKRARIAKARAALTAAGYQL